MAQIKWFYKSQGSVKEYLNNNYDQVICNSQNIHPDHVYESYSCTKGEKNIQVLIMTNKREQIAVYEMAAMFHI